MQARATRRAGRDLRSRDWLAGPVRATDFVRDVHYGDAKRRYRFSAACRTRAYWGVGHVRASSKAIRRHDAIVNRELPQVQKPQCVRHPSPTVPVPGPHHAMPCDPCQARAPYVSDRRHFEHLAEAILERARGACETLHNEPAKWSRKASRG